MSRDLIIGVDAGTSVIKAVAFDLSGRQLALAETPNTYEEAGGGAVEQDMARTWRDTVRVLRMLGDRIERLAERIIAVAVTGQGDGTWLIDEAGEPVAAAWLWLDSRAGSIVEELAACGTGTRYVDLATLPKTEVHRIGSKVLYHCQPPARPGKCPPILVTYALGRVNTIQGR